MNGVGLRVHAVLLLLLGALLAVPLLGARARAARGREAQALVATVRRLPSGDFALSGSGRHLRHVSLAEPGTAFVDVVAGPDGDPAGGAMAPPRGVW